MRKKQPLLDMSAEQLVDHLEEAWPARCVLAGEDLAAANRYAGKVELITTLRARIEREKENYGSSTQTSL